MPRLSHFGKGPQLCVAVGFPNEEALLAIAGVVRAFRLTPSPTTPMPVSRLTLRSGCGTSLRFKPADAARP